MLLKYLSAVSFKHDFLRLGFALGICHGVLHPVRRVFIAPAERLTVRGDRQKAGSVFFASPFERNAWQSQRSWGDDAKSPFFEYYSEVQARTHEQNVQTNKQKTSGRMSWPTPKARIIVGCFCYFYQNSCPFLDWKNKTKKQQNSMLRLWRIPELVLPSHT